MKDILDAIKREEPSINDLILSIEPFLLDQGFNSAEFEKELSRKLNSIKEDVIVKLKESNDSKN